MKLLQAPNLKTIALTKTMHTAIISDDEQAFDNMSEESEKYTFSLRNHYSVFQGKVEQVKKYNIQFK